MKGLFKYEELKIGMIIKKRQGLLLNSKAFDRTILGKNNNRLIVEITNSPQDILTYHTEGVKEALKRHSMWISPNWFLRKISNKALYIRLFELE